MILPAVCVDFGEALRTDSRLQPTLSTTCLKLADVGMERKKYRKHALNSPKYAVNKCTRCVYLYFDTISILPEHLSSRQAPNFSHPSSIPFNCYFHVSPRRSLSQSPSLSLFCFLGNISRLPTRFYTASSFNRQPHRPL
jgi:hypothetical protein